MLGAMAVMAVASWCFMCRCLMRADRKLKRVPIHDRMFHGTHLCKPACKQCVEGTNDSMEMNLEVTEVKAVITQEATCGDHVS